MAFRLGDTVDRTRSSPPSSRLLRIALLFRLTPGYPEGVVRGLAAYARPRQPWLFRFFETPDVAAIRAFAPDAGVCCLTDPAWGAVVKRLRFPMVNTGIREFAPKLPQAGNDDHAIGVAAARHFLDRGFTRFVCYALAETPSATRRGDGFIATLAAAGHTVTRHLGMQSDAWLRALQPRTAIFAFNDHAAAHLADRCRDLGLRLPEDVALIGADNIDSLCLLSWPPLSSVAVAAEGVGHQVGIMLDELLAGRAVSSRFLPPVGIVTRQSSDVVAVEDPHLAKALRFIAEHASSPIRVRDVMRVVPIARRTLEARFRARLGRSLLDEIQRVHLERAKHLLLSTAWPMSRIAVASGFSDAKRFATVFGQVEGASPLSYRRATRPTVTG
jgi:LacI family transcriptional regulator